MGRLNPDDTSRPKRRQSPSDFGGANVATRPPASDGRRPSGYTRCKMMGKRIYRLAISVLTAGGWIACVTGSLYAQENAAERRASREVILQQPDSSSPQGPVADPCISGKKVNAQPERAHRFWDTENDWLFAGVGASRTFDYFSTLNMRRRGRQEILLTNDAVDNHAAFAAIEASATGVSIGAAYLFHHYGHHKLERWTSVVHIGLATTGAVRNYCLKTAHGVTPASR